MQSEEHRRLPVGAEVVRGGVAFRVWAPHCERVAVVLEESAAGGGEGTTALRPEDGGYFHGVVPAARAGTHYRYRLDGSDRLYPDPASRFQPEGPDGPSRVVDPSAFHWTDGDWCGVELSGQVAYEMHIGTFTRAGTWSAAADELPELHAVGLSLLEVMPVAEFAGRFGWGYDGVDLFAPSHLYGEPDDLRHFVNRAHVLGMGVILDVVYNHLGPDGNYLGCFAADYFTDRYSTDWGAAVNFDGANAGPVREFFVANAGYWIDEFHLDGLRLDATQNIYDGSAEHVLAAISRRVRAAARGRATLLIAENEPQQVDLLRPLSEGGFGMDALWNDDFHHSATVALCGRTEAYYTDYGGTPQEFISGIKWGYLYQGQRYAWQHKRRGSPTFELPPAAFINFLENHDQLSNSGRGERLHRRTSPGRYKALTALLLLGPQTPMLFQGQEFAASSPFPFFADHNPQLMPLVRRGRREFLSQFPSLATPEMQACLLDPGDARTFECAKLDHAERARHAPLYALHRDLLHLRRDDPVFHLQAAGGVDGAVLGPSAFVVRFFDPQRLDRLLVINLGSDLHLDTAPEPLLAPPAACVWELLWSSEDPRYGGCGTAPIERDDGWHLPAEAAVVLRPREDAGSRDDG